MPKNPLGKIKDAAGLVTGTVVDSGQKVVGQAVGTAVEVVAAVTAKVPGRKKAAPARPATPSGPRALPQDASTRPHGDPVRPAEPVAGTTSAKKAAKKAPAKKTAKKAPAKKLAAAGKPEIPTPDETALGKKATAGKPAQKTAKKAAKGTAKRAPAKKTAAKKAPATRSAD